MAYPSLTFRGAQASSADQLIYTFSAVGIGNPSPLRAVVVFIGHTTFSGAQAPTSVVTGVTIGGVAATYMGGAATNITQGFVAYAAYVPDGTTADIVVTYNLTMTRCVIGVYTLKPSSLTLVDSVGIASSSATDLTLTDVATVNNGAVLVGMLQLVASTNVISWTGSESITTDSAQTGYDANALYATFLSILPTSTTTTNDLALSSVTATRRLHIALSFNVQGTLQDTLADSVDLATTDAQNAVYAPTPADIVEIADATRYTPVLLIEETLADDVANSDVLITAAQAELIEGISLVDLTGGTDEVWADDGFFFQEYFRYGSGITASDTLTLSEDSLTYFYLPGSTITEGVRVSDAVSMPMRFVVVMAESGGVRERLLVGVPVHLTEAAAISLAASVVRSLRLAENLRLLDSTQQNTTFNIALLQSVRLSDNLRRFLAGSAVDGIVTSDVLTRITRRDGALSEAVGVAESITPKFLLRITATDTVGIDDTDVLKLLYGTTLLDGVEIAAAYISPGNTITTWTVNTKSMAVSEYTNFSFNSLTRMGHKYLGTSSAGLYELNGDSDDGSNIVAQIKSGMMQLGGSRFTSFKAAYIGQRGTGDYVLKVETGDGKTYNYAVIGKDMQTSRVHFGKGLRARYFSFELISTGQDFDLDSVEFIPLVAQRRV